MKLVTKNEEETKLLASSFAKLLSNGDTVVLTGELGSGKTKFVEGFLSNFGLENEISSPTFNIVNEHHSKTFSIYHFDVYRLSDSDEFYAIGGEEYFENGICLIEWGEIINDALPSEYIHITISKDFSDENIRIFEFKALGDRYNKIINKLEEELN